jgi:hypothetical protein
MDQKPPDVMVLGPEWPERALVRAQLIDAGYEVAAIDAWPPPRAYRQPAWKPRVLLIDLRGLPDPRATLEEVPLFMAPERVLVITALGSVPADEIARLGFTPIRRPATVGDVVAAVAQRLSTQRD